MPLFFSNIATKFRENFMFVIKNRVMAACAALALAIMPLTSLAAPEGERFIVQFKDGRGTLGQHAIRAAGASVVLDLSAHNAVAAHIPAAALSGLQRNPNIEFIETDEKRYAFATQYEPNSPYGITMVQADLVTQASSSAKTLCIIDSGIQLAHPEFSGNTNISGTSDSGTGDWFTDENSHGTHVAGTIMAAANGAGVVGVNPDGNLNVHIIKVFGADGWAYSSGLVAALDACESAGADVVSMSLGGTFKSNTENRAFDDAAGRGVLSIAAAGNAGNTRKSFPASYDSVVSVAAIDSNKVIADFSQQNDQVEIAAPGVAVLSSVPVGTGSDVVVQVGATGYEGQGMDGSPYASGTGTLVDCGTAESTCAGASGNICLIQRGNISFADKVLACQAGGGDGAIIYNNEPGNFGGTLGETATSIPSVSVSDADGAAMLGQLGDSATVSVAAGDYAFFDGTSMATPHVSGVAALVWNNSPGCNAQDVRNAMNATAEDLGSAGRDNAYGFGLVQARAALDLLQVDCGGDGGDGDGGGSCDLGQPGDSCSSGAECCSGSCKGKPGSKTCR
jgi:subtilisin family serine protease